MPMILLQISSAHGPVECCQAVALATKRICLEAQKKSVTTEIIERTDGPKANTYRSIVLALQGQEANTLAQRWSGSVKWICPSQYRLGHKRKNWFIGVSTFKAEQTSELDPNIVFESMRSSGPGGQHVNTTESAIRATHLATGISVKVQNQRSQHANKRLAVLLIAQKLQAHQEQQESQERTQQWLQHYRVQRGNPVLTFQVLQFEPV